MDPGEVYLCHQCGKIFYKLSTLESHAKWKHMEKSNEFMCEQCGRTFQKKYNLLKHLESGIHAMLETVKCALCDFRAANRKIMGEHYNNFHEINMKESNVYFKTAEEFFSWKSEFENRTRSRFVKMSSSRKRKNDFIRSTYFCHRDGNFIPKGRNLRHLKVKGSNKINAHCPAKMDVDFGERIVIVTYIDVHLGHELDITRMSLDHADKALIAKKLSLQVPFEQILDEINHSKEGELKRVNLLTRKDLWNIVDTFKIDPKSVVYSKTRVRRRRKMDRIKKETKKHCVFLKVVNEETASEDRTDCNLNENEQSPDGEVISVKEDGQKMILYPVMVKNENDEYVQEYAVISGENGDDTSACLIINSQGELESISGHRISYTEDGDMEICEAVPSDEGNQNENEQSVIPISEAANDGLDEIFILNGNGEEEVAVITIEEGNQNQVFDIVDNKKSVSCISDNKKPIRPKKRNANKTNKKGTKKISQSKVTVSNIKQEIEDCHDLLYLEKDHISEPFDQTSAEETSNYEVTVSNIEGDGVNEYVIIASEEDLNSYNIVTNETGSQCDFSHDEASISTVNTHRIRVKTEDDGEAVNEEVVGTFIIEGQKCIQLCDGNPAKWSDESKEVLHTFLNISNAQNSNDQVRILPKDIPLLRNVSFDLSKGDKIVTHTSDSKTQSKNS